MHGAGPCCWAACAPQQQQQWHTCTPNDTDQHLHPSKPALSGTDNKIGLTISVLCRASQQAVRSRSCPCSDRCQSSQPTSSTPM